MACREIKAAAVLGDLSGQLSAGESEDRFYLLTGWSWGEHTVSRYLINGSTINFDTDLFTKSGVFTGSSGIAGFAVGRGKPDPDSYYIVVPDLSSWPNYSITLYKLNGDGDVEDSKSVGLMSSPQCRLTYNNFTNRLIASYLTWDFGTSQYSLLVEVYDTSLSTLESWSFPDGLGGGPFITTKDGITWTNSRPGPSYNLGLMAIDSQELSYRYYEISDDLLPPNPFINSIGLDCSGYSIDIQISSSS